MFSLSEHCFLDNLRKRKRCISLCVRDANVSGNQCRAFTFIDTNLENIRNREGHEHVTQIRKNN